MEFSTRFQEMETYITSLQDQICSGLEACEGNQKFQEDIWQRPGGGGGRTRVIQDGDVFEKGGINISSVYGELPKELAEKFKTDTQNFAACGLSLVIHPHSPMVPTIHMNVRYFEMQDGKNWYGGGIDLTPYYPLEEDFIHFHQTMKNACDHIDPSYYSLFKKECDQYFTIVHRQEMRGVGGIFFDYLRDDNDKHARLVQSVGNAFLDAYVPIVQKRKECAFTNDDKNFQLVRRGRYVEFNLVYDRGTLFGLKTNGRIESILMSLPKEVRFLYDWQPAEGSAHEKMAVYYQPREYLH